MYSKLIIDTSNFYMRAYSVGGSMTNRMEDGSTLVTGGIYTFLRMMKSLENRFLSPDGKVYFLFDNSHSGIDRRKKIDPEYKSNRTKKDDNFYRSMDLLQAILLNYKDSWLCVKKAGYEADDLVYPLIEEFSDEMILLVSNDLDWFRGISERVHVAKYEKAEGMDKADYVVYTPELFCKRMGFKASEDAMILYKSFRGDSSDNIPAAVPGIRTESLIAILNRFRSVKEVLESIDSVDEVSSLYKDRIKAAKARLFLNEKLVSYQKVGYDELAEDIYQCEFHARALHSLYKSLGFQIGKIDPRVQQFFVKETAPITNKNFFQKQKIKRV